MKYNQRAYELKVNNTKYNSVHRINLVEEQMLGNNQGRMLNNYIKEYVLFDLETTGISSTYDEVIEIAAVKVKNGKVVEEFSGLVNPKRPIPYAASMVNNITDDMVKDAPTFDVVLKEFIV